VRSPRRALEPANADNAVRRGTRQVMALLWPYLSPAHRAALRPPEGESSLDTIDGHAPSEPMPLSPMAASG
jgi:hypothetical protein